MKIDESMDVSWRMLVSAESSRSRQRQRHLSRSLHKVSPVPIITDIVEAWIPNFQLVHKLEDNYFIVFMSHSEIRLTLREWIFPTRFKSWRCNRITVAEWIKRHLTMCLYTMWQSIILMILLNTPGYIQQEETVWYVPLTVANQHGLI